MRIIDINNKKRKVSSIKKIINTIKDKDGNDVEEEFAEVIIIGRYRPDWKEWYPLKQFLILNPRVRV